MKKYGFEHNGEIYTLSDCVEICALSLAKSLFEGKETTKEHEILNALTEALLLTKGN